MIAENFAVKGLRALTDVQGTLTHLQVCLVGTIGTFFQFVRNKGGMNGVGETDVDR